MCMCVCVCVYIYIYIKYLTQVLKKCPFVTVKYFILIPLVRYTTHTRKHCIEENIDFTYQFQNPFIFCDLFSLSLHLLPSTSFLLQAHLSLVLNKGKGGGTLTKFHSKSINNPVTQNKPISRWDVKKTWWHYYFIRNWRANDQAQAWWQSYNKDCILNVASGCKKMQKTTGPRAK